MRATTKRATKKKRVAKPSPELLKAMQALLSMPPPPLDLAKIRRAMAEHDKKCGLCKLIFGIRK